MMRKSDGPYTATTVFVLFWLLIVFFGLLAVVDRCWGLEWSVPWNPVYTDSESALVFPYEYRGDDYWCHRAPDYVEHPLECPLKYLHDDEKHDGIIYLAPDGTVRWKMWKKGETPETLDEGG